MHSQSTADSGGNNQRRSPKPKSLPWSSIFLGLLFNYVSPVTPFTLHSKGWPQSTSTEIYTHTHTHRFTALWKSRYQKKHSPTHIYRGHQSSLVCFIHLLRSIASSLINLQARQSFSTISLQVFFGLSLGLASSTSYSIHFFTQSLSSSRNTCHTIATCFAVVPRLCHLILLSLNRLLGIVL